MNIEPTYKVIWIDDQNLDRLGNTTPFFDGWQFKADKYNIVLEPFDNWEDAEKEIRRNFEEISAIILDAHCKIRKDDIEQETFITSILPSLLSIFGEKRVFLPWYLLSAGTMSNFRSVISSADYQHENYKEDWGEMLYLKDAPDNEQIFVNIQRVAKHSANNIVLYRHHDVFSVMGEGKLIDRRARKLMLQMLSALYYPEENIKFEFRGNPLRQVVEYLFRAAYKQGFLAKECFDSDGHVNLQWSSLFLAGYTVIFNNLCTGRWGNGPEAKAKGNVKVGDHVFDKEISELIKNILGFTNIDSHTNEEETWYIDEERKDIFFGYVLQMCHVIKWFSLYVEKHPDIEQNKKNIRYL